tara:strand:+ start:147 stop:890 length:744 start_codon:yes stop_codon:yes gene_type:complete
MKKLLFLTAIAVFTFNSSIAQDLVVVEVEETSSDLENPTRKGRIIGVISGNYSNSDITQTHSAYASDTKLKNKGFGFDLNGGYTIIDNLSIGLAVGIRYDKKKEEFDDIIGLTGTARTENQKVTSSVYMFESRYYFLKEKFKPFIGAAIGYNAQDITGSSTTHLDRPTPNQENYALNGGGLAWRLHGGLGYFINDNVAFHIAYAYTSMKNDKSGSATASGDSTYNTSFTSDDANVLSNIVFGVQVAF